MPILIAANPIVAASVTSTAITLLGAVFVGILVASEWRGGPLRPVAKPAASLCFVAVGLFNGALDSAYGTWVLVALVLSAAGDVALLGRSTPAFLAGLTSFLAGHVGYIAAFGVRGIDGRWMLAATVLLAPPVVIVLRWLLPHAGSLRGPVVAYTVVITAMVAAAAGTVGSDPDARILLAAVAFYVSDLAVARDRFIAPGPVNRLWGLPLYYAAQFLLAWTVVV